MRLEAIGQIAVVLFIVMFVGIKIWLPIMMEMEDDE